MEQRNRNSCLVLLGISENENENIDGAVISIINSKFGVTFTANDLQHRDNRNHLLSYLESPISKNGKRFFIPNPGVEFVNRKPNF